VIPRLIGPVGFLLTAARQRWRLLVIVTAIAVISVSVGAFSIVALDITESATFCGRCHTMKPELDAYERGSHSDVKCGECHVGPGIMSFVKAKLNGTRQMFEVLTNTHPKPIRAEPHKLPSPDDTCSRCHDRLNERRDLVVIRSDFGVDEANTEQKVGLAIRLSSTSPWGAGRIHGHNELKIQFVTSREDEEKIDWIRVERTDGTSAEYVAARSVHISTLAGSEVDAMKRGRPLRTFGCTDCHNRAGHELISPEKALDEALASGHLDRTLPFIKREALRTLTPDYASRVEASKAIASLRDFYVVNYPDVYAVKEKSINEALTVLGEIYEESASPEMKANYRTYPNNLGHEEGGGCFRCHDGAHVRVDNGRLTQQTLAWECSTCHSFPIWGGAVVNIAVNQPPQYHSDTLWLFTHKDVAQVSDPVPKPCSNCHTPSFCTTCHATGVRHDQMLYSHAALARDRGNKACAFCHQQVYCAQCHTSEEGNAAATPRP